MQVLCCDWLLEVRAGVWEASADRACVGDADAFCGPAPHVQLRAFQRDLHSLRRISQNLPVVIPFIYLIRRSRRKLNSPHNFPVNFSSFK